MGEDQVPLELAELVRLDPGVLKLAETGIDTVDRLAAGEDAFDRRPPLPQPLPGPDAQADGLPVSDDAEEILHGQVIVKLYHVRSYGESGPFPQPTAAAIVSD